LCGNYNQEFIHHTVLGAEPRDSVSVNNYAVELDLGLVVVDLKVYE
jgi:hypothetical protein